MKAEEKKQNEEVEKQIVNNTKKIEEDHQKE